MHLPILAGPRRRTRRAILAAAIPALLAAVALPSAAQASGFAGFGGDSRLLYSDTSATENNVTLRMIGGEISIRDTTGGLGAQAPCRVVSNIEVRCPANVPSVVVATFVRNDTVEYRLPHRGTVELGEGNDTLTAGRREGAGRTIEAVRYFGDHEFLFGRTPGFDFVSYRLADRGVQADPTDSGFAQGPANDGRPGDLEDIQKDFESLEGSEFGDSLFGSNTRNDIISGLNGNDVIGTGGGADVIVEGLAPNGSDFINGGNGAEDTVSYGSRTSGGVNVFLDARPNDGAPGEQDDVRPSVENVIGTNHADVLIGNELGNLLHGIGGDDTIDGLGANDDIFGGAGANRLFGNVGDDLVDARNGERDEVDCGANADRFDVDAVEASVRGCETRVGDVGRLSLAPNAARVAAGEPAQLRLSWRHPRGWRKLRKLELRLTRDRLPVGKVTIRPRGERISDDGAVTLVRKRSRLTRKGKTVTARLAVRLDESLAGQRLGVEVEATDMRGARQIERDAGTVHVAS